jgi:hypothetical protein
MSNKTQPTTRREALRRIGNGFGMVAFANMLGQSVAQAGGIIAPDGSATGAHKLDHPQRVKRVIFLFMNGGLSTIDSFDPKPASTSSTASRMPGGSIKTERRTGRSHEVAVRLSRSTAKCGMDVSELWPHLSGVVDDICWVRSVHTEIRTTSPRAS